MDKPEDGVEEIDPSAPEGGSKKDSVAPQDIEQVIKERDEWKQAALKAKRQNRESKVDEIDDERITHIASIAFERAVSAVTEDSLLKSKIQDPEQRKVVKEILDTRIKRTGTSEEALDSDIEDAINLANSKQATLENSELKRAIRNDSRVAPAAGSSADRGVERKSYEWSPEQDKILTEKAKALRLDPEKFKADAWKNRSRTTSIA